MQGFWVRVLQFCLFISKLILNIYEIQYYVLYTYFVEKCKVALVKQTEMNLHSSKKYNQRLT